MLHYRKICVFFVFSLFSTFEAVSGENILLLMGMPSPSHHIWFRTLAYGLAEQQKHNVTVLSTDIEKEPPDNVHYIYLENIYDIIYNYSEAPKFNLIHMSEMNVFGEIIYSIPAVADICTGIVKSNGLKTLMNYPKDFKFDLIIFDYTIGPCLLFLLKYFNYPPLISATAFGDPPSTTDFAGGHKYYAYNPYYGLNYDTNMNFWQKCYNVLIHFFIYLTRNYAIIPKMDNIVRSNLDIDFPYLGDLEKETVLVFVNTHPAVDPAVPVAPNIIPVGGLQIREPKELPHDIENFINQAEKGVVLFSLGTNVRSDMLGADVQKRLLEAFSQMPEYNFLWKFETDTLPMKLPKNVLVQPWLPQSDILAHPRTKAFFTHAGLLSTHEATWYGVPLIGMPFIVDQHRNLYKSIIAGVAEMISYETLTTAQVKETLLKVIEVPSYREKMKIRSARFRDQKEKPLERALWWIDWVLRNKKPDHIQSPVMKLGFIKSNIYDIVLFIFVIIATIIVCLYKLLIKLRSKTVVKLKTQ